ncbi:mandelate racemase/muconate lactonizing enzyme family protein [Haliscomenobacter sp.]|uniref:mandelate racemase/muconate lactonizing enzyme family protein n=1 Tax=Haliscomenobacter sp. TaxID=2717303 RepID=UPI0035949493
MQRRSFFQKGFIGATAFAFLPQFRAEASPNTEPLLTWPVPDLKAVLPNKVLIDSIELLKVDQYLLMVVRSNGQIGITQCNDRMPHLVSLLKGLVLPHFIGFDARDLVQLVDNAYRLNSNYKYTGMPLWNCIGSVEIAIWDLLGRIAQKPVHQLLGTAVRSNYPVYISDWSREGDPAAIIEVLQEKLKATGAKGVKIKIGGRMVNTPENAAQTRRFVPALRKGLGDAITIYADANGSYNVKEGIEAGRLLEDHGVAIFEEPCNFEDEEGMRQINKALKKVVLAGGEQDSSLFRFRRLAQNKVYDILQPDLYYNGGIMRTLQVSAMASHYGLKGIAPHTPKADPLIAPFWQVAAVAPNLFGFQEFVYDAKSVKPTWYSKIEAKEGVVEIPTRPGLGIDYDLSILAKAVRIV